MADELLEHVAAPAGPLDAGLVALGVYEASARGRTRPMSAHILGRPNDDLLDIIFGHGADPEQPFIRGSEQGGEEGRRLPGPPGRR